MFEDPLILALVGFAFVLAGAIKGVIGMGLPLTAMAILSTVMPVREAIPVTVISVLALNIFQAVQGAGAWATLRRFALLYAIACAGIWGGTFLLFAIDPRTTAAILGTLILVYVVANMVTLDLAISRRAELWMTPAIGATGGILGGLTGSLVVPVVLFLQSLNLSKDGFIQATGWLFLLTAVPWFVALWQQGAYEGPVLAVSIGAVVPAALGMLAGTWLRRRISQRTFRNCVFAFLTLLGLNLLRQAIF